LGNRFVLGAVGLIIVLQLFFTYLPFAQRIFGTAVIPLGDWLRLIFFTLAVFLLVELEKYLFRKFEKQPRTESLLR